MLADGAKHPEHTALFVLPAALLSATVGSAYLLAEGIREVFDPVTLRLRTPSSRARTASPGV